MSIHLSFYFQVCSYIYVYLSTYLSIHQPVCLFVTSSICLLIYRSNYIFVRVIYVYV